MSDRVVANAVVGLVVAVGLFLPTASAEEVPNALFIMRADGTQVRKVAHVEGFVSVEYPRWSHDGKRIVFDAMPEAGGLRVGFVVNADATGLSQIPSAAKIDWSPDDKQLVLRHKANANAGDYQIVVQNVDGQGHSQISVGSAARWSPDGSRLSISDGTQLRIVDLASGEELALFDEPMYRVMDTHCWSPDGKQLAVVVQPERGNIQLRIVSAEGASKGMRIRLKDPDLGGSVSFSPDGKQLAVGIRWQVQILEVEGDAPPRIVPKQEGRNRNPDWSPDGQWIVFASDRTSETAATRPAERGRYVLEEVGRHAKGTIVYGLAFTPDGRRLVMGGDPQNNGVSVLDLSSGQSKSLGGQGISIAMFPDGRRFATSWLSPTIQIVDIETGNVTRELQHGEMVRTVDISLDGRFLVSGGLDKQCQVWDTATGETVATFTGHGDWVARAVFSPDGKRVYSTSYDQTLRCWETRTGKELWSNPQKAIAWGLAISRDGKQILTGSGGPLKGSVRALDILPGVDHALRLWDAETGRPLREMHGHSHVAYTVDFSPDGKLAVSGSRDRTLRLWDLDTGKELCRIEGGEGSVNRVAFSPDGKQVVAGGGVSREAGRIVEHPNEQMRFYRLVEAKP